VSAPAGRGEGHRVRVLDSGDGPELSIVASRGAARAIVWPGIGAELRSMTQIVLEANGETFEMTHPGEAVYYVAAGEGEVVDGSRDLAESLVEGSMFHVEPGTPYLLRAGGGGMTLLGGPAPADPALYEGIEEAA
jgi:quercetin dioxygenase-like cupin family protein